MSRTAVIFYHESKWRIGEDVCFGFRIGPGYTPKGTVVCGFMIFDGDTPRELIAVPNMGENQIPSWETTLTEAREFLRLGHVTQETLAKTRGLVL